MDEKPTEIDATVPYIIDNGSYGVKVGLAGEMDPGILKGELPTIPYRRSDYRPRRRVSIEEGNIPTEDKDLCILYEFMDNSVGFKNTDSVIITQARMKPEERLNVARYVIQKKDKKVAFFTRPWLAFYASGLDTGIVVHVGHEVCQVTPFYEKSMVQISDNINKELKIAGKQLTEYAKQFVGSCYESQTRSGSTIVNRSQDKELWRQAEELKHNSQFVDNFQEILSKCDEDAPTYDPLFQRNALNVGGPSMRIPEPIFKPKLFGQKHQQGLHEIIKRVIDTFDEEMKELMYGNIVLSGGTTLIRRFPEKLKYELEQLDPGYPVNIISREDRGHLAFIGASMLGLSSKTEVYYMTEDTMHETRFAHYE